MSDSCESLTNIPEDRIAATIGPLKFKGRDDMMITITRGTSKYEMPVVLGKGDQASNLVICAFKESPEPLVGYFVLDARFRDGIKPGTSDIIFDEDVEDILGTKVFMEIHSKQVVADFIAQLQGALDKWVAFEDEREKERQTSTESDN